MAEEVWRPLWTAPRGPNQAQNCPYTIKSSILEINSWKLVWKHTNTLTIVWWESLMAKGLEPMAKGAEAPYEQPQWVLNSLKSAHTP